MAQVDITPEIIKQDGQRRIVNTTAQGGVAGAIVVVGEWVATEAGWDGSLPTAVAAALVVLITAAGSVLSNRSRLRA